MRAWICFVAGWLALGLLGFGCEAKNRAYQCDNDNNCMAGEACIDGECQQVDCRIDADCEEGERCQDYDCVLDVGCQADDDCGSSEACVHGQCQTVECKQDGQCPEGQNCVNYQCVTVTDCTGDGDCLPGEICEAGMCVSGCREDADCPDGRTCLVNLGEHGVCAECQSDSDCPDPLRCIEFSCVEYCANDGECPQGQICIENACREGCRDDGDCPEGVCDPQSQTCVECLTPDDCPSPLPLCEDNVCVPECVEDGDCPQGQICIDGNCLTEARECDLVIEPEGPCEFSRVRVGSQIHITVSLSNLGYADCLISGLEIRNNLTSLGDFLLAEAPELPLTLSPVNQSGFSTSIQVVFTPLEIGQHQAALWLSSNDPDLQIGASEDLCYALEPPEPGQACIVMEGTGVSIDVVAVPSELDFGGISLQCGSAEETIRITNLGSALTVSDFYFLNPDISEFRILSHPQLPYQFGTGQSFNVSVQFLPEYPGSRSNSLMVEFFESSVSDLQIPLYGECTDTQSTADVFELPDDVAVDILFVVDNSNTMVEEQDALAENFIQMISWALTLGVDFQVGVTSTDMEDSAHQGRLQGVIKIITPQTPNPEQVFAENVRLGTDGSWEEQGLAASHAALSLPLTATDNAGFLREQAKLHVIYVSDEDDLSPAEAVFYTNYFLDLKDNIAWVGLSAICGALTGDCQTSEPGLRYHAVVNATQGLFQDICQNDWSTMLSQLGEHIFAPIRIFSLTRHPEPGSIEVTVDGQPVAEASCDGCPDGWTYLENRNNILFGRNVLPAFGSLVEIRYQAVCY